MITDHKIHMKKKNSGFTLVELLVGVAILAVIIVPILNNILVASRTNMKAYNQQQVTILGNNLMEGLKAESSIADVAKQFVYDGDVDFDILSNYTTSSTQTIEVEKNLAGEFDEVDLAASAIQKIPDGAGYKYVFNEDKVNREHSFAITDLATQAGNYDVLIQYNAKIDTNEAGGTPSPGPGPGPDEINSVDIPVITSIAIETNAVINQRERDNWAVTSLQQRFNAWWNANKGDDEPITVNNIDIQEDMQKKFYIDISYNAATAKYEVDGTLKYNLTSLPDTSIAPTIIYTDDHLFHSTFDTLENVYLFFRPNFKQYVDYVFVNNNIPEGFNPDINFYLVEQAPTAADMVNYFTHINNYHLYFVLNEVAPRREEAGVNHYRTVVRHNIGNFISNPPEGIVVYNNDITQKVKQDDFITYEKDKTRIWRITVQIFEAADAFSDKFNSDHLLASYESTKGE